MTDNHGRVATSNGALSSQQIMVNAGPNMNAVDGAMAGKAI